ncbi:MAG: ankyrin repeat domain-containing protein [Candidatus Babeliales bacterium]|jgi:ankyrin repeat protein
MKASMLHLFLVFNMVNTCGLINGMAPSDKENAPKTTYNKNLAGDLLYAAADGNDKGLVTLLAQKADPNTHDLAGFTPLIYASDYGHIKVVEKLLAANADVNAYEDEKYTALMAAAAKGYSEIVKKLLEAGADVNAKNQWLMTALIAAAKKGHANIVRILLDAGADITPKDADGMTELEWAQENGHNAVIALLKHIITDRNEIRRIVAEEWCDGLPSGGQTACPLEVLDIYIMRFLD